MKTMNKFAAAAVVSVAMLGLTGCWEDANDGPAEKFGESVDEAVNDAGRALEDAAD